MLRSIISGSLKHFSTTVNSLDSIQVFRTVKDVRGWRRRKLLENQSVGLIPTMGALHRGHLSLIKQSMKNNEATVVSIFVNPSQFAPHEDLDQYPRTFDSDLKNIGDLVKSENYGNLVVFAPTVDEMYPTGVPLEVGKQTGAFVEVKGLSEQLEGGIRPHFFRGVATIVTKLLNVVSPENAYFGQKDVQQTVVVKRLVQDLLIPTNIVVLPTVREDNGLAMSSRNAYLTEESFEQASILYKALAAAEELYQSKNGPISSKEIIERYNQVLHSVSGFDIEEEYFDISHKTTLEDVDTVIPGEGAILSAAVKVPNKNGSTTRIIDNVILN